MKLTPKELATVLAALRSWQENISNFSDDEEHYEEHYGELLTDKEIDELCERLNCGDTRSPDYERARSIVNTLPGDGDRIFMHRVINASTFLFPKEESPLEANLERVLGVCTGNITEKDSKLMTGNPNAPARVAEHDEGYGCLFVCTHLEGSCIQDMKDFGFSEHFIRIMRDAEAAGFDYVYFDRDASYLPDGYPTFEW